MCLFFVLSFFLLAKSMIVTCIHQEIIETEKNTQLLKTEARRHTLIIYNQELLKFGHCLAIMEFVLEKNLYHVKISFINQSVIFGKQFIQSYLSQAKAYNHTEIHSSLSQLDVSISNMQPGKNNPPLLYTYIYRSLLSSQHFRR